jgi:hypothetical protein
MRNLLFINCLFMSVLVFGQSKKDVKKFGIKSITETLTTFVDGKALTINDSYQKFDKKGQLIEEMTYDRYGKVKHKRQMKYNNLGDKEEESTFDSTGHLEAREVYKYDSEGEKIEEIRYGAKGELLSKAIFTLDARGLKTERKTYDAKNKLIEVKKYIYE